MINIAVMLCTETYYDRTTKFVTNLLRRRLHNKGLKAQAKQWNIWTKNWCQFSFESFLRSTVKGIKSQLEPNYLTPEESKYLDGLSQYIPWPDQAINAYTVFTYTSNLDVSLVSMLQEDMGHWWSNDMHSLKGGLSALPIAFADPTKGDMEKDIVYNRTVTKVEYIWTSNTEKYVTVSGVFTSSGESFSLTGRSVILTPPLHVIRGMQIVNGIPIPDGIDPESVQEDSILKPFPREFQQAIQNISYSPSTKIMLQYKSQFWNKGGDPQTDITGGFSKTNMPIGQLHYPTEVLMTERTDGATVEPLPVAPNQKGILMVYTWKAEALLWGALEKDMAIRLAVDQIDELHPGVDTKSLFEVGYVQAWASDPTTLGAFALLRPREYTSVIYLMQKSWRNVYFAGEAISFANGWIQGALESGLRAAYQLFSDDQAA